ncbi:hypothetical protein DFP75_10840 [Marinomonas alcarazii]|uniref:HEPN domain-containing protein n=1 Tax=Marinomonas alcarazii TaxID=491949 RepID=A0A318UVT6_9GAMM|nr:hypothetical protein [Marinomonas alcarazii]PYF79517.1 hypothetical protein DFP75_10840 [Marinomonas alcarazii]
MLTRKEFERLIVEIDRELGDRNLLFHQRPMHAFSSLAGKLDPKGVFPITSEDFNDPDDFSNEAIFTQVHNWYEETYGDRTKIHMGPGSYILIIKGEPWKVELPLVYGRNNFTIDSDLERVERYVVANDGKKVPSTNILWHVENITRKVALSLSDEEREIIFQDYMFALNSVQFLRDLKGVPYMEQGMNDYDTAIHNIFYKYPDYNNAKWSALQFAEKTIKSKLKQHNVKIKHIHFLSDLSGDLEKIGINVSKQLIDNIQCDAKVRYGEQKVTRYEAVLAIRSSLSLFSDVFRASSFEINT